MRIFRWLLLIANVIVLMQAMAGIVVAVLRSDVRVALLGGWVIAPLLANIVFILITWRWRHEGKAASRIAGAFD